MGLISGIEHDLAVGQDGLGLPEMDHGRSEQANAGMAVLFVVPPEKLLTEGTTVLDAAETIREYRPVSRSRPASGRW